MLARSPWRRTRETLIRRASESRLTAAPAGEAAVEDSTPWFGAAPGTATRATTVGPATGICWITVRGGCVLSMTWVAAPVIDASSATLRLGLFAALEAMFNVSERAPTALLPTNPTVTLHEPPGATDPAQPVAVKSGLLVDTLLTARGTWPVLRSTTLRATLLSSARRAGKLSDVVLNDAKAAGAGVGPAILPSTVNRSLKSPPDTSPVTGSVTTSGSPGPDTRIELVPVGLPTTVCGVVPSPMYPAGASVPIHLKNGPIDVASVAPKLPSTPPISSRWPARSPLRSSPFSSAVNVVVPYGCVIV